MLRRRLTAASFAARCSMKPTGLALPVAAAMRRAFSTAEYVPRRDALMEKTRQHVLATNTTFQPAALEEGVKNFFDLGLEYTYVKAFSAEESARHVLGFVVATTESSLGKPFSFACETENNAFWWCESSFEAQRETQQMIEKYVAREQAGGRVGAVSFRSYNSSAKNRVLFVLQWNPFRDPSKATSNLLEDITTDRFLSQRSKDSHDRYRDILSRLETSITPVYTIRDTDGGQINITMGFQPDRASYLTTLTTLFHQNLNANASVTKRFVESFLGGQQVYSFFISGATKEEIERAALLIGAVPNRPDHVSTRLYNRNLISAEQVPYLNSLIIFAYYFTPPVTTHEFESLAQIVKNDAQAMKKLKQLRLSLYQDLIDEKYIGEVANNNPEFILKLFQDFKNGPTDASCTALENEATALLKSDGRTESEVAILKTFVRFNRSIRKTNYFKSKRAATAYRLDPPTFMTGLDFPTMPFGVFLLVGQAFRGFHVRFADIARGGIRMILYKKAAYRKNRITLFQENYNLAHAQLLKNKDIPESGSKGTILVSDRAGPNTTRLYMQYIDALCDVLVPGEEGVRDNLGVEEHLFLGPDENTAGELPSDAALHARSRGYKLWKAFTTGKNQSLGGIPHEIYGMTTESVRTYVKSIYKTYGLDETQLVKFQTGGPDGDLGSNEILLSHEKYLGIVDKSGVLYDPAFLDREELARLAKGRPNLTCKDYDRSKLSDKGFFVPSDAKNFKLPDGTVVESGETFLNTFHASKYVKCDVFVPCGGRPAAVTLNNVHELLVDAPAFTGDSMVAGRVGNLAAIGKTRFKYIVEGANLFITQDARIALENCGVVVVKDSAANKGGVTSSSFEVLACMCLNDAQHAELMCVKDGKFPPFYNRLVEEIVARIRNNAQREFDAMQREVEKGTHNGLRTLITDDLSQRIVRMRVAISKSDLFDTDKALLRYVLRQYIPKVLLEKVTVDDVLARVPENYLRAIFSTWLSSEYVYATGLGTSEYDFFRFMQGHVAKMHNEGI